MQHAPRNNTQKALLVFKVPIPRKNVSAGQGV